MRQLTTDMTETDLRPYFLWDEDVSIAELHEVFAGPDGDLKDRYLGKMLREARDIDVWHFVTPSDVARALPRISRRVGRRIDFWRFLLNAWQELDLVSVD